MENLNVVAITGNLTRDPELRHTGGGTPVAALRVAVNSREKSGDEWKDRPNYFDVTVFGRQAENAAEYLSKGSPVAVQGALRYEEWQGQDGGKRSAVKIVARSIQYLHRKDGSGGAPQSSPEPAGNPEGVDDDIPF